MIRLTTALALAPCQVRAGTCLQRSWTIRAPVLTSPSPLRFAPSEVAGWVTGSPDAETW